ncbi:hypothetical protein ACU6U9_05925 [Pseudomonas sp. HK3]
MGYGTDITNADSDNDGLTDAQEHQLGTIAVGEAGIDSDQDGIPDFVEVNSFSDPLNPDEALIDPFYITDLKITTPTAEFKLTEGSFNYMPKVIATFSADNYEIEFELTNSKGVLGFESSNLDVATILTDENGFSVSSSGIAILKLFLLEKPTMYVEQQLTVFGLTGELVDFEDNTMGSFGWYNPDGSIKPWIIDGSSKVDSSQYSLKSGEISPLEILDFGRSKVEVIVNSFGGELSFDYIVNTAYGRDYFNFYVNGNLINKTHGTSSKRHYVHELPAGKQRITFEYIRSSYCCSRAQNAVWLDNIFIPSAPDTDRDGVLDSLEYRYFGSLDGDLDGDIDGDGLSNALEIELGTDLNSSDSDNDGIPDGVEVELGLNPLYSDKNQDSDGDGFSNAHEYLSGSDIHDANSVPFGTFVDFETNEFTPFYWSQLGNIKWGLKQMDDLNGEPQNIVASATSAVEGDQAILQTTVNSSEGTLLFDVNNLFDESTVDFYVDGLIIDTWTLEDTGERVSYQLTPGRHTLMWVFSIDYIECESCFEGDYPNAYIDNIFIPAIEDSDHDGYLDAIEYMHFDNLDASSEEFEEDEDGDNLSLYLELKIGSDPQKVDTDGDGLTDQEESNYNTDPTNPDTDQDLMTDAWEINFGFNPLDKNDASLDNDNDTFTNAEEFLANSSPVEYSEIPFGTHIDNGDTRTGPFYFTIIGDTEWEAEASEDENTVDFIPLELDSNGSSAIETEINSKGGLFKFNFNFKSYNNGSKFSLYVNNVLIEIFDKSMISDFKMHLEEGRQKIRWQFEGDYYVRYSRLMINKVFMPAVPDSDNDGIKDSKEYAFYDALDFEINEDLDSDQDGITDLVELNIGSNPVNIDSDGDSLPDKWEYQYGLNLISNDIYDDIDRDGFSNISEYIAATSPIDIDSKPEGTLVDFEDHTFGPFYFSFSQDNPWGFVGLGPIGGGPIGEGPICEGPICEDPICEGPICEDPIDNSLEQGFVAITPLRFKNAVDNRRSISTTINSIGGLFSFNFEYIQWNPLNIYVNDVLIKRWDEGGSYEFNMLLEAGRNQIKWEILCFDGCADNAIEINSIFFPATPDSDEDGLSDAKEYLYYDSLDKQITATTDSDGDGLTDVIEFEMGSHPLLTDTDNDGLPDGWEYQFGLDMLSDDSADDHDNDFMTNKTEYINSTSPIDASSRPAGTLSDFENGSFGDVELFSSWSGTKYTWLTTRTDKNEKDLFAVTPGMLDRYSDVTVTTQINSIGGYLGFNFDLIGPSRSYISIQPTFSLKVDDVVVKSWKGTISGIYNHYIEEGHHTLSWRLESENTNYGKSTAYLNGIFFPALSNSDSDGMQDSIEYHYYNTLENNIGPDTDMDQDNMSDLWEVENGLQPNFKQDFWRDLDSDGYTNLQEHDAGTDPNDPASFPVAA